MRLQNSITTSRLHAAADGKDIVRSTTTKPKTIQTRQARHNVTAAEYTGAGAPAGSTLPPSNTTRALSISRTTKTAVVRDVPS